MFVTQAKHICFVLIDGSSIVGVASLRSVGNATDISNNDSNFNDDDSEDELKNIRSK